MSKGLALDSVSPESCQLYERHKGVEEFGISATRGQRRVRHESHRSGLLTQEDAQAIHNSKGRCLSRCCLLMRSHNVE